MTPEAAIVINGFKLSTAQSMTLRVALGSFLISLQEPDALGDDYHGRHMTMAYREHAGMTLRLINGELPNVQTDLGSRTEAHR